MFIGEKMEEISTTISYDELNLLQVVVGIIVYQNGIIHSTKWKMVSHQLPQLFFFTSLKVLAVESSAGSGCRGFRDTAEKVELINMMLKMH